MGVYISEGFETYSILVSVEIESLHIRIRHFIYEHWITDRSRILYGPSSNLLKIKTVLLNLNESCAPKRIPKMIFYPPSCLFGGTSSSPLRRNMSLDLYSKARQKPCSKDVMAGSFGFLRHGIQEDFHQRTCHPKVRWKWDLLKGRDFFHLRFRTAVFQVQEVIKTEKLSEVRLHESWSVLGYKRNALTYSDVCNLM